MTGISVPMADSSAGALGTAIARVGQRGASDAAEEVEPEVQQFADAEACGQRPARPASSRVSVRWP